MNDFSEQTYFAHYKKIRNKFRKYDSISTIGKCLQYLHKPAKDNMQQLQKHPWLVLLLIKWILLDEECFLSRKTTPSEGQVLEIMRSVRDLGRSARMPSDFDNLRLFFRVIAYQQFIFQREPALSHIARQFILFSDLPNNHLIKEKFRELAGIDIGCFLELALVTLVRFIGQSNNTLPATWFQSLQKKYSQAEIDSFLSSISKPLPEISRELKARDNARRPASEYYEPSPFLEFPLIKAQDQYLCVCPHVLYRCIEHFIYDRLRLWNAERFMAKFGDLFEAHVEQTIQYTKLPYINESFLKDKLKCHGNLIDFVVIDDDANVFIDAKAVEMAYRGKIAHLSDVVKGRTKDSALKAIKQAHDIIKHLHENTASKPILANRERNYLIVVGCRGPAVKRRRNRRESGSGPHSSVQS